MSVFHRYARRIGISEQSYAFSKENVGEFMGEEWVGRVVGVAVERGEGAGGEQRERVVLGVCLRERGRAR